MKVRARPNSNNFDLSDMSATLPTIDNDLKAAPLAHHPHAHAHTLVGAHLQPLLHWGRMWPQGRQQSQQSQHCGFRQERKGA